MSNWAVFDFDGTLSTARSGWTVLAALFGTEQESFQRKREYYAGAISFEERIDRDVNDWKRRDVTRGDVERAAEAVKLSPGTETLLEALADRGYRFGVLSAGVVDLAAKIRRFDPEFVVGNALTFREGRLDGARLDVSATDKADRLAELGDRYDFDPSEILYVGDSNSDTEAFEIAGHAVLFNPDPALDSKEYRLADAVVETPDVSAVLEVVPQS